MQTIDTYISKTESAARKLFEGIQDYTSILDAIRRQAEFDTQSEQREEAIANSLRAQRQYSEEVFALATLCGAVLQLAAKAIEIYSTNSDVPRGLESIVGSGNSVRFCIGRETWGLPIGLIIMAGRNQHTHFNETKLNRINLEIFDRLASYHGIPGYKDPAFDLDNPKFVSCAHNVTAILGWRSYDVYVTDLLAMLK